MNDLVSVIVPAFNCEKTIKRCLDSIVKQKYKNIEILVINDGSTDQTKDIYLNNFQKIKNIQFYTKRNEGVSSARNYGIKKSKGKYIMFVDSDDSIDADLIYNLVSNFKEGSLLGANIKRTFNSNKITYSNYKSEYTRNSFILEIVENRIFGGVLGYLFEKKHIPLFDTKTSYMEDTIFLFEYLKVIHNIRFIKDDYYNYFMTENSITNTSKRNKIIENVLNLSYSISSMNKVLNEINIHSAKELKIKNLIVLESEFAKLKSLNDINVILNNKKIYKIVNHLSDVKISFRYSTFVYLVKKKYSLLLYTYVKARRFIKKILVSMNSNGRRKNER